MTSTFTMTSSNDGPVSITVNGEPLDEKAMAEAMAKAKESGRTVTYERRTMHDEPGRQNDDRRCVSRVGDGYRVAHGHSGREENGR